MFSNGFISCLKWPALTWQSFEELLIVELPVSSLWHLCVWSIFILMYVDMYGVHTQSPTNNFDGKGLM